MNQGNRIYENTVSAIADESSSLKKDFHHPFKPYAIQETFMSSVYEICQEAKVGILESPTGTGKSLSLICGSMTWLRDYKKNNLEDSLSWGQNAENEPDWVINQAVNRKRKEMLRQRQELEIRIAKVRKKEAAKKNDNARGVQSSKKRKIESTRANGGDNDSDDEEFVLQEYDSDVDDHIMKVTPGINNGLSESTITLMEELGMISRSELENEEELEDEVKIFYCSRTHSQLTQFVNELRRVKMIPSSTSKNYAGDEDCHDEEFKHVPLGSRRNLCINPIVSRLKSVTAMNERCLELQQNSTSTSRKCKFLPNKDNAPLVNDFRDHTLATVHDIEELGSLGQKIGICPYYASRAAIKPSEIVTLPYQLLLQKSARDALGIDLKGHVVIIDEAHNLMDTISAVHSASITHTQLKASRMQVTTYLQKFRNKLKGKNRIYIAQAVRLLDSLSGYLEKNLLEKQIDGIVNTTELLSGKGVDQINLFKLNKYLLESKLARKVEGYNTKLYNQNAEPSKSSMSAPPMETITPVLQHVQSLLFALTNPSKEGRIFFSREPDNSNATLRYMLLDPVHHFKGIVSDARAVILAGGTMSPMSDYVNHLLPYLEASQIQTLSCEHVIPKENLIAWPIEKGPSGIELDFTFANRGTEALLDELGRVVLNLISKIPDGVVIFFPSYAYLDTVIQRWQRRSNTGMNIWERLAMRKQVFQESKESVSVDETLQRYGLAIDTGKGGLLLSVVGGKMSEGINFSDRLGRGIMIVGMPFPNIHSPEWKAKLEHIEDSTLERIATAEGSETFRSDKEIKDASQQASREYYENACMRAVNQSIGRAIRHKDDYAVIVLLDKRYRTARIREKLPGWIQDRVVCDKSLGGVMGELSQFFARKAI